MKITKDQLRKLNAVAGKLDTDTGRVVVGFVGKLEMKDRLYHGEIHYQDNGDNPPKETVSIKEILSTEKKKSSVAKTDPEKTITKSE